MFDVVVAGGGIGGLSFALAARAAGLRVCVLERSANVVRANLGGGLGLWPPSQQVLRELGVLPALIERGRYMPPPRYCNHRGQVLGQPTRHFAERFPILCVERSVLLEVLEAGVMLRPACELRSYTATDVCSSACRPSALHNCSAIVRWSGRCTPGNAWSARRRDRQATRVMSTRFESVRAGLTARR